MIHEFGGTAHISQMASPLSPWIGPLVFAKTDGLSGEDNHRDLLVQRAAHSHGRVQRADGGVNHHRRQFACRLCIAARHAHGDFLMASAHINRHAFYAGFRQRFPQRRPFRSGGGKNPLHTHLAQNAQHGLGTCQSFSLNHVFSLNFRVSNMEFRIHKFEADIVLSPSMGES